MGNSSGQAYALMVMTPILPGQEDALRAYLQGLPSGSASPLARLGTTHFARWIVLHDLVYQGPPQERDSLDCAYLIFTSNFDGSLEKYLASLHRELREECDRIWGSCVGYPVGEGPEAFAAYLHHNQVDTTFFFSAYPEATVADVLASLDLRRSLIRFAVQTQSASPWQLRRAYDEEFGRIAAGGRS